MEKSVVLGGTEYRLADLKAKDLVIDVDDGEGGSFPSSARVWFDRDGEPVVAEPYRESADGSRWYYSRELDFGI